MASVTTLIVGINDMATTHPALANEWHPDKNLPLTPIEVFAGTGRAIWWQCSKDSRHVWQARGINRFNGAGCPFCSGRRAVPGVNDLKTLYPKIAVEWHPIKNGELTPTEFLPGSHKKVWWQCSKNKKHEWETTVGHRLRTNCPFCANRKISKGENDLVALNPTLAKEWNPNKNGSLTPQDVTLGSHRAVWWMCLDFKHEWKASIVSRNNGNGCPICSNKIVLKGFNDLATTHPLLAQQWSSRDNGELTPQDVTAGSKQRVWWVCERDTKHTWLASIAPRSFRGVGCPVCANLQVLVGFNDFATTNPGLAAEWHVQKNGTLKPSDVVSGSNLKVWWQCINFPKHIWMAGIKNRMSGTGCPECTQYGFRTTAKGLFYVIANKDLKACKVGITNPSAKRQRVSDFQKLGWEVIQTWQDDGLVILNLETKILQWIRKDLDLPAFLAPQDMGRHGGWSETFSDSGISSTEVIARVERELLKIRDVNEQNL